MSKTDFELVQDSIKGNHSAFEELVGRYKNLVYSVIFRMVNHSEDANDLAQEVFIKTYRYLDKYNPEYKFSTWLIKIATNTVIDFRRRKRLNTVDIDDMVSEPSHEETPERAYLDTEERLQLSHCIDELPEMYQIPIILYHIEDMSYQEIADSLDISLSKVKNRIFRGRKILKDLILSSKDKGGVGFEM